MFAPAPSSRLSRLGSSAVGGLRVVAKAIAAFLEAARNRREARALLTMDDCMLRDIGITRGDVHSALASAPRRDPTARLRILAVERRAAAKAALRERYPDAGLLDAFLASRKIVRESRATDNSDCSNTL
ncbi:protein of unknown function [Pseudoxanthobacter soli DSM 19599]|uniref:YjiS-like domain-containing protein n=1 Tax=Pseudoxanthobacter soli DSM 19599 TaxID=1123029 RepID=A0A1M7ZHB4_9HYPH|nr:DUF1127 domain-containing protein [Pseudoxanthobacter soli]SHO64209.1 protein of unknown function [Pseudoxanthobacter soli DSM 19599]